MPRPVHFFVLFGALAATTAVLSRDEPQPRTENWDANYKGSKPTIRVEEPDEKSGRLFPRPLGDLKTALQQTRSGSPLLAVYRGLLMPHDVVYFTNSKRRPEAVVPLNQFADAGGLKGTLDLTPIEADSKPGQPHQVLAGDIEKVRHYEQLLGDAARSAMDDPNLGPIERLAGAEQLLAIALTFNESARRGDEWKPLAVSLRRQLLQVQLKQIEEIARKKDWDNAVELAHRLTGTYSDSADQSRIAAALVELLASAIDESPARTGRLRDVRRQVRRIVDPHEKDAEFKDVAARLHELAVIVLRKAKKAEGEKDLPRAEELAEIAADFDPQLDELRDYRNKLNAYHPILHVGVRSLPHFMSPALATTDTEQRAVELLFEGLVKSVPGRDGGVRYRAGLAASQPRLIPMGRQFFVLPNATWSNGQPVTWVNVSDSVEMVRKGLGGRPPVWASFLGEVRDPGNGSVNVFFTRGLLDPLAAMTFKIVPDRSTAGEDEFARNPIGSGPFRLGAAGKDERGDYVSFVPNVGFASRPGHTGQPHIREIRFYAASDPVKDLKDGRLELALDLTAAQMGLLRNDAKIAVPPPTANRRVYFLAVNHQTTALANRDFRRGLALAIHREELLNVHFRKDAAEVDKNRHKPLNSPFPAGSWAGKDENDQSPDPYDRLLAESLLARALTTLGGKTDLSLKYPNDDPVLAAALGDLKKQVAAASKDAVTLKLEPLDPHGLRKLVEKRDYQLAYWHYDYPDETYWLGPLLGQDGENSMSYRGAELQGLIQDANSRREFETVRKIFREMRGILDSEMPLIPLWQLDPLAAYRTELKMDKVPFDPLLVFSEVEHWRLVK